MRGFSPLIPAAAVALSVASPALARVAASETRPQRSPTEQREAIEAAIKEAAAAMGLTRLEAGEAFVVGEVVTVQILASDAPTRPRDDLVIRPDGGLRARVLRGGRGP